MNKLNKVAAVCIGSLVAETVTRQAMLLPIVVLPNYDWFNPKFVQTYEYLRISSFLTFVATITGGAITYIIVNE